MVLGDEESTVFCETAGILKLGYKNRSVIIICMYQATGINVQNFSFVEQKIQTNL